MEKKFLEWERGGLPFLSLESFLKNILSDFNFRKVVLKTKSQNTNKITKKSGLSSNQVRAINILAHAGLTQQGTADAIGVSLSTVNGWLNRDEEFIKAYQAELDGIANFSRAKFKAKVNKAVDTIFQLLDSTNEIVRLNAAKEILARAEKGSGIEDRLAEARLEKIKAETAVIRQDGGVDEELSRFEKFEMARLGRKAVKDDTG